MRRPTSFCFILSAAMWLAPALPCFSASLDLPVQLDDGRTADAVVETAPGATAPTMAAVIIPGTGVGERDGGDGGYARLAHALAAHGFAAVRFDAPRAGAATDAAAVRVQAGRDLSLATQKQVLVALVRQLRAAPARYRKIILVTHSQGGLVAAQLLSKDPALADGLISYGMTLRPMAEAMITYFVQFRVNGLRELTAAAPSGCIANADIDREVRRNGMAGVQGPPERWFAPQGKWCREDLAIFARSAQRDAANMLAVGVRCATDTGAPGAERIGNHCEEMALFTSRTSIEALLTDYPGMVGIAWGSEDILIEPDAERAAFARMARRGRGPRASLVIRGAGHGFGIHPLFAPSLDAYLDTFARFAARVAKPRS